MATNNPNPGVIKITQGDANVQLQLTATDGNGDPINLTGATFQTFFRVADGQVWTIPNGQHTANPDQITNTGQYTVTLMQADTEALPVTFGTNNKEIITQITIGSTVTYYHGMSVLQVLSPIPVK